MPRGAEIKTSFTAGELNAKLRGRIDLAKWQNGARTLLNVVPMAEGGVTRRPGTHHVTAVKTSADATRLIEFKFSVTDTYILEFGDQYVRFYRDGAQLESTPGTPTEIASPYSAGELAELEYVQSADVLYLLHPDYQPRQLTRSSGDDTQNATWSISTYDFRDGPYLDINDTDTTLTPDQTTGTIRITASAITGINGGAGFLSTDVGRLIRMQFGKRRIKDMKPAQGGSRTTMVIGSHTFQIGDTLTITGTVDYNGTHTVAGVNSGVVTIQVAFTYDQAIARNEVQDVDHDHTGGTFTLSFLTEVTTALNFNDTTANIQAALEALSTIGAGNVAVTGTDGTDFTVTFQGALADQDVDLLVIDDTLLTGGTTADVVETFRGSDGETARLSGSGVGGETSWDLVEITAHVSTTQVDTQIPAYYDKQELNATAATSDWRLGAWSDTDGWPWVAVFHQNRLWFGGSDALPQTLWGSVTSDFVNHEPSNPDDGVVESDDGIVWTISDDQVNAIRGLASDEKGLLVLTEGGAHKAVSSSTQSALTPSSFQVNRQTTYGKKANVRHHQVGDAVLFIETVGPRLRELRYGLQSDRHSARDLSILSRHLLVGGIVDTAWQENPEGILWMAHSDGSLISATYLVEHEVIALARHTLGGTGVAVESVAVIREGNADQLWMVVKRTINSVTVRHIEYLEGFWNPDHGDALPDAFYVDAGLKGTGGGSSVTGLDHLEGETVEVFADGALQATKVVSSGSITADWTSTIIVGLPYTHRITTNRLMLPVPDARGRVHHPYRILLDLLNTVIDKATIYTLENTPGDEIEADRTLDPMEEDPSGVYTGLYEQALDADADSETWVTITQTRPLPMTVLAIIFHERMNDG